VCLSIVVGIGAVASSAAYVVSGLLEPANGGFTTLQLVLTHVAEAPLPLFVLGLAAVQMLHHPVKGRTSL